MIEKAIMEKRLRRKANVKEKKIVDESNWTGDQLEGKDVGEVSSPVG